MWRAWFFAPVCWSCTCEFTGAQEIVAGAESTEDAIKVEGTWSSCGREVIFRKGVFMGLNMTWEFILQCVLIAGEHI